MLLSALLALTLMNNVASQQPNKKTIRGSTISRHNANNELNDIDEDGTKERRFLKKAKKGGSGPSSGGGSGSGSSGGSPPLAGSGTGSGTGGSTHSGVFSAACYSNTKFADREGFGCHYYTTHRSRCDFADELKNNAGVSASTTCCICGGGEHVGGGNGNGGNSGYTFTTVDDGDDGGGDDAGNGGNTGNESNGNGNAGNSGGNGNGSNVGLDMGNNYENNGDCIRDWMPCWWDETCYKCCSKRFAFAMNGKGPFGDSVCVN